MGGLELLEAKEEEVESLEFLEAKKENVTSDEGGVESIKRNAKAPRKLPEGFGVTPTKRPRRAQVSWQDGIRNFDEGKSEGGEGSTSTRRKLTPSTSSRFSRKSRQRQPTPTLTTTVDSFLETVIYPNQPEQAKNSQGKGKKNLDWVLEGFEDFEPGVDGCWVELKDEGSD